MSSPIRLALFLCDTPIQPVLDVDGDYTKIFDDLLRKSAPSNVTYIMDSFDVRNKMEYPKDIDQYNGIILTGSGLLNPRLELLKS
jgi:hypothetical protein